MCWNEWKFMYQIFPNFSSCVIGRQRWSPFGKKNDSKVAKMQTDLTMIFCINDFCCAIWLILYFYPLGYLPTKDTQTPSPQFCSRFNEICAICWIERKFNFPIFIFWINLKIHWKLGCFEYKNDHNSENKNPKIDFSLVSAHCTYFI